MLRSLNTMLQPKMFLILISMLAVIVVIGAVEVKTSMAVDGGWTKFNKSAEVGPCRCVSGGGFRERVWRRTCTKPRPRGGGRKCKGRRKVVRIENCDSSVCNIAEAVAWGQWSEFGRCSTTCGEGIKTRWRYWNEFDPVKKKINTENIPCDNPQCPISFSLRGENYQLISRLQGYKWDIRPGWGFVCNDEPVVGDLLEIVEAMEAEDGNSIEADDGSGLELEDFNNQPGLAMQLIEGTAMFVKQAPLNSGEEAWQYIEVDDPTEEVDILNWEFVPINNSNIADYQKQMCHLLSSPEEAEKMDKGLLKIFRKKVSSDISAESLSGNASSSNSKLIKSLQGGPGDEEPFRRRKVKNYRIPSRDLNKMNSRRPFNWREKGETRNANLGDIFNRFMAWRLGLDPDLQPLEPRLSERMRMSSFTDENDQLGSSSDSPCQCINGSTLFLASHTLMERGYGVVSGRTKCQCVQNNQNPGVMTDQQNNQNPGDMTDQQNNQNPGDMTDQQYNSNGISSSNEITTPGYFDDRSLGSKEDSVPPSTANATDLYTMGSPSNGDSAMDSHLSSNGDGTIGLPLSRRGSPLNRNQYGAIISAQTSNVDRSSHFTDPPNGSQLSSSKSPITSTSFPIPLSSSTEQQSTTVATTAAPTPCPPTETIMERCTWLTSITKQQESFHSWDQDGDGLLTAEEWMVGRKGKDCISATDMKYYVEEAIKTIQRFDGDGVKTKATFLEFYAINRGTSHAFDC